jgi:Cd2+/Zn2+-exporting ATPase
MSSRSLAVRSLDAILRALMPHNAEPSNAWTEILADFLLNESGVEAIRVNPDDRKVSIATLGAVDLTSLQTKLSAILKDLDQHCNDGVLTISRPLNLKQDGNDVLIQKPSCLTAPKLWHWRDFEWPEPDEIEEQSREEWQVLALQAAICGAALLAGFIAKWMGAPEWAVHSIFAISLISGGWDAAVDTWEKIREGTLDIHFLMLAVAAGAVSIGAWEEGALLLFLFSTSGALEHFVLHRTHREINSLMKAAPKQARVMLPDGTTEVRAVAQLVIGDLIQVRPDELFPVDGTVTSGQTAADESTLTGEAVPITKEAGAQVFGGTLNLWGLVQVRVDRAAQQSALQKIITLIENAQHMRAPSQRFTDNFGTRYTVGVLVLVFIMFFVWWLGFKLPPFANVDGVRSAFYRAMTLLVVMSPCALVLSIPSAILAAIAWGAKRGVLFRGGAAIEKLAEVDTIAMDKTGTLTEGELKVAKVESFPPGREVDALRIAVTLEANSNHPIARAITAYGKQHGVEANELHEFQSIAGQGLRGKTASGVSYVGRRELMAKSELSKFLTDVPDAPLGFSEVWVLHSDVVGRVLLKDEVRTGSKGVLERLAADGVRTVMLTGDRRAAAVEVAKELGIDEVRAGLHPEDKVAAIKEFTDQGRKVAMVGDGVNDAPSLAAAYVSVAMGARGSDAALEQSDVVLMQDKIEKLLSARRISHAARVIIKQNIAISLGAVLVMAISALFGVVPLTLGVLAHEGSTVIVCLNSLRLLFVREE